MSPRRRGDAVVIGFRPEVNQTEEPPLGQGVPEKAEPEKEVLAPYASVLLRQPVGTLVVEQDVRREIDAPPVWKLRATFKVGEY